jgi:hypothetical protein
LRRAFYPHVKVGRWYGHSNAKRRCSVSPVCSRSNGQSQSHRRGRRCCRTDVVAWNVLTTRGSCDAKLEWRLVECRANEAEYDLKCDTWCKQQWCKGSNPQAPLCGCPDMSSYSRRHAACQDMHPNLTVATTACLAPETVGLRVRSDTNHCTNSVAVYKIRQ